MSTGILTPKQEAEVEARVEAARAQGHLQGMLDAQNLAAETTDYDVVKRVLQTVLAMLALAPLPAPVSPVVTAVRGLIDKLP